MAKLLKNESSPYLQQHKDNLVHWYPWCDEAFLRAKNENKAIFISIGYSSCHWCHVMEYEVFQNKALAKTLNKDFICIKVDKEERPDIDKFYQGIHLLLNRRLGGWPISIFSTPDNQAFYADTYIPLTSNEHNMGFFDLIEIIALKISKHDKILFNNAKQVQILLQASSPSSQAARITENIVSTFMKQCNHNFDINFGGFGQAPKFPQVSTLRSLLDIYLLTKDDTALHMLTHTLDSMILGGVYDLVHSGFCRYATEPTWHIPHFEKMTYDNALLIELFILSYKVTKNTKYLKIAQDTTHFMLNFMSEDNLFYSASDADSDGVEGKYFMYNYKETLLYFTQHGFSEKASLEIFAHLHILPIGSFAGGSIIRMQDEKRPKDYEQAIQLLKELRKTREYPFIDKKILTSWNMMMIKSLFLLSNFDPSFKDKANTHLKALINKLYINQHLYHTVMINEDAKIDAFLEDYAYATTALIQAYQSSLDTNYLELAQELADQAIQHFFEGGKWYFSKGDFITEADIGDSSYAGSISVILDALLSLGSLVNEKYRDIAFISLQYYSAKLVKKPMHYPYLFNQALRFIKEDRIIKGDLASLKALESSFFELDYPFIYRHQTHHTQTLLCGVQSCYTRLKPDCNLQEELNKTI